GWRLCRDGRGGARQRGGRGEDVRAESVHGFGSFSKLQGRLEADALDVAADRAGRRHPLAVKIVELELDVGVPVPVHPDGVLAIAAALDEVVAYVHESVTVHDFPSAPAALEVAVLALHQDEVLQRPDAVVL